MNVSGIITEILEREGSKYTNDPADKGGPTKYGITQKTLSDYRGRPVTADEVSRLTEPEARSIYFQLYVRGPGFQKIIDEPLMALAVDCGVNHGQERAIEWLQELVGVRADGEFGPVTADAINRHDPTRLYLKLVSRRVRFYGEIVTRDWQRLVEQARKTASPDDDAVLSKMQAKYSLGWANRAAEFIDDIAR